VLFAISEFSHCSVVPLQDFAGRLGIVIKDLWFEILILEVLLKNFPFFLLLGVLKEAVLFLLLGIEVIYTQL